MITRRNFIGTIAAGATGLASVTIIHGSRYQTTSGFFGLHPFIENHPEAVFITRTGVDVKTNADAIRKTALDFARSVFVSKDEGIPLTHTIPIKPNLTWSGTGSETYSLEYGMGIVTDPYFVEGVIEGIKELGLSGSQFYMREVNSPGDFGPRGYYGVAERTGADLREMSAKVGEISENDLVWVDIPDGVWFSKIPYLWPVNAPDTWLLNISKFKTHAMGLTLSAKNLQGAVAHNYQEHCSAFGRLMDVSAEHVKRNAFKEIQNNYDRHIADGIPRWERPGKGSEGGIGQETWASRCLDNNSVTQAGLHIIEGVYARDGNGFFNGPNPTGNENNANGEAKDYMSNIIIFGKNPFHVDSIGHWLGGHEPGNFGLFHLAVERGLSQYLDPKRIPVYLWENGTAVLATLDSFDIIPLKTFYLQRDYDGQEEPYWHLCDEPYDYGTITSVDEPSFLNEPEAIVLHQNSPNPFNPYTTIEYSLPKNSNARLEIYNGSGQLVDVLVDGYRRAGAHMAVWNTGNYSSGLYFYRFRSGSYTLTKKMMLVR